MYVMVATRADLAFAISVMSQSYHGWTMQHHFIRETIVGGVIDLRYCPMEHMAASVLTRGIGRERHEIMSKAMQLEAIESSCSESFEDR